MRFMMFVASDNEPDSKPEAPGEIEARVDDNDRRGKRITGNRLQRVRDARTVRVRGGRKMVTDGPFTEAKVVILGFDILECDSIEEAIEIAGKDPMARSPDRGAGVLAGRGRVTATSSILRDAVHRWLPRRAGVEGPIRNGGAYVRAQQAAQPDVRSRRRQ